MPAPRTYCIALPVFVTVHDDGTVTYDIDVAEANHAPYEFDSEQQQMLDENDQPIVIIGDVLDADAQRIEDAFVTGRPWARTPNGLTEG